MTGSRYDDDIVKKTETRKISDAEKANIRFGARLRAWRESKNISMLELSKRTGLPHANISGVERGTRSASEDMLQKISQIKEMEISLDELKAWQIMARAEMAQIQYIKQEIQKMETEARQEPI